MGGRFGASISKRRRRTHLGLWILALIAAGCGPPPPPPGAGTADGPTETPEIAMILPAGAAEDHELGVWQSAAMVAAGREHMVFTIEGPKDGDPPDRQAGIVREAIDRGVAAVILVPPIEGAAPPSLIEAATAARDAGAGVVVLGSGLSIDGPRVAVVAATDLGVTTDALVAALQAAAQAMGRDPKGPSLVVARAGGDRILAARARALKASLAKAGVDGIHEVEVPEQFAPGRSIVFAKLTAIPGGAPTSIVAVDDTSLDVVSQVRTMRRERDEAPDFVLGGFALDPVRKDALKAGFVTAVADLDPEGVAFAAVQTAVRLIRGESVPARVDVPEPIRLGGRPLRSAVGRPSTSEGLIKREGH